MAEICIKISDNKGNTLGIAKGEDEVNLVYCASYHEGDRITVEIAEYPAFYWLQLDDAKGRSLVYLTGNMEYNIPFGEARVNQPPKAFSGNRHLLAVRKARSYEYGAYRNLAVNVNDQHGSHNCYPHASANVETRGESVFAAMNAIDGVTVTNCHGEWPYESWGINQREDAVLKLEFGRMVEIDRVILYTRADYPHDSWWEKITIRFSDGSTEDFLLKKTGYAQDFTFDKKCVEWLELKDLMKADTPSPFPALVQLEVYGADGGIYHDGK